jgi:hypothetical protein
MILWSREYLVRSHLGSGGFVNVYRAFKKVKENGLVREVALKILKEASSPHGSCKEGGSSWKNMRSERDLMQQCCHMNLV